MADPPDLVSLFVVPLNSLGVTYMITGAVAAVVYGEPRFTRDLDVVLEIAPADAPRIAGAFAAADFYVPPEEALAAETRRPRHGHFNIIHHDTGLKADCYVAGDDPLHRWALTRRIRHDAGTAAIWVAPLEYVIARKLEWFKDGGSSRHVEDIQGMLRVSGELLDHPALERWIDTLGVRAEWDAVRDSGAR